MYSTLKDKVITVVLVIICLSVFFTCLFLYNNRSVVTEEIVLIKDMSDTVGRIKTDRSESLNTKGKELKIDEELVDKTTTVIEDDTIILSVPKTEEMKGVEEVLPKEEVKLSPNTSGIVDTSSSGGNTSGKKEQNPLPLYELNEEIEVIRKETTTIAPNIVHREEYYDLLMEAKKNRNKGRTQISTQFSFIGSSGGLSNISSLSEYGVVVVPFYTLSDETIDFIKELLPIYNEYKSKVPFIFVSSNYDSSINLTSLKNKLKSSGITENLRIFLDNDMIFVNMAEISLGKVNCILLNSDCYKVREITKDEDINVLKDAIKELSEEEKRNKEEDRKIRETGEYIPRVEIDGNKEE